ncbi:hypothetical protein ZIOFF_058963 [Zingiber officinale]|uniref:Tyrosine specific protein phosphatases domain-containing protein n=1 Tax=Zingiber officinale TaxID=94328 RepID=A0A8J5F8W7_ZINOF|nr:hypothetical protein ZIOFF_058963 [Zingiber officinale]
MQTRSPRPVGGGRKGGWREEAKLCGECENEGKEIQRDRSRIPGRSQPDFGLERGQAGIRPRSHRIQVAIASGIWRDRGGSRPESCRDPRRVHLRAIVWVDLGGRRPPTVGRPVSGGRKGGWREEAKLCGAFLMDLNASPSPEEDERPYKEHLEGEIVHEEIIESAVATMRREREERRQKLKRENRDEGHKYSQQQRNNYMSQSRNTKHHGRVKEVPQGWLDCPSYGQCIGLIIPSKVPLDETYNESVLPGKRYSSKQVINKLRSQGRELGLVIDLTNTSRYYSQSEWIKIGIKHVKARNLFFILATVVRCNYLLNPFLIQIPCKGRDSVPDNESVNIFVHEVLQFLSRMRHSKRYILVHCTHGHNRTGFMIIHFLMRTQRLHVSEALQRFAQARPPGIYKQDYVEALYKFYHECPENIVCPSTPEWKRSSDLDLNGEAVQDDDDDDDGDTGSGLCENVDIKILTNDDVLGDAIPYDQQDAMRHLCYQFLDLMPPTIVCWNKPDKSPYMNHRAVYLIMIWHGLSFEDNLQLLRQRYYYATWKADGTRYMMFINSTGCYLIDRNFCFRRVQMRFPLKNAAESFHNDTLIDGEMIIDQIPDVGQKRRYLAYDLVALNGFSVMKLPFSERWKLLEEEVIRPRNYERKQLESDSKGHPIYRYDMEPFSVRRKDFWFLSTVTKLLKEFIPRLSHEADGLIFQGWDDPYIPRTHEGLLKWKYPEMNSVDFLFEVGSENRQMLFLYERGKKKLMDEAQVSFPGEHLYLLVWRMLLTCPARLLSVLGIKKRAAGRACAFEQINLHLMISTHTERQAWIHHMIVMRSIKDNITEEVLLNEIAEIVRLPMYTDRIERAQQIQHRQR